MPHQVGDSAGKRERNLLERHAGCDAKRKSGHRKGQRRMQPHPGNQKQQKQNRPGSAGDQIPAVRRWGDRSHRQIIPYSATRGSEAIKLLSTCGHRTTEIER